MSNVAHSQPDVLGDEDQEVGINPKTPNWTARISTTTRSFVTTNKGVILVTLAQFFGSMMNMTARILEHEAKLHPLQVLFARMSLTTIISFAYMWWNSTPDFPLGHPSVRRLLVARGLFGFFGIYGIWSSLMYLDLGEATVLTFLVPSVAGYACHIILHERFTVMEQLASFVAFAGVVVIARPVSLFVSPQQPGDGGAGNGTVTDGMVGPSEALAFGVDLLGGEGEEEEATPLQRLFAIGMGMLGVVGASGAYTLIRWIGKRAHPLISVSYFSGTSTIASTAVLALAPVLGVGQPELRFDMPHGVRQWGMLVFLGACGFIMQFLLTSGLRADKTNRATMAIYSQIVFAVAFDKWVFGKTMDSTTVLGCSMIIGSAIWVTVTKRKGAEDKKKEADEEEVASEVRTGSMESDPERTGLLEGQSVEESDYGAVDARK